MLLVSSTVVFPCVPYTLQRLRISRLSHNKTAMSPRPGFAMHGDTCQSKSESLQQMLRLEVSAFRRLLVLGLLLGIKPWALVQTFWYVPRASRSP